MEERPAQISIDDLLADLINPDPSRRVDVLNSLAGSGIKDQRILSELRLIAKGDPDPSVREAARKAMRSLGINNPVEKKKDFWRGVGLFFGLNVVMALCSWGASTALYNMTYTPNGTNTQLVDVYSAVSFILGVLPLLINIGLMIYFAFTHSQIALGMLAGFGIAFLIVLILGVILTVWCFVSLGSGGY